MRQKTVPQHLTEQQLSDRIGVSVDTLREMRTKPGQDPLPFIKIGKCVRYSESDVADWLERRRVYDSHEGRMLNEALKKGA